MDQERRPRHLGPEAQVPDRDHEQERPEEQSKPPPPQQATDPVGDQGREDKAEQQVPPWSVEVRDQAGDRGPRRTEAHPERRFPSPPPHKEAAGGAKPTRADHPGGSTAGDLYKAAYQRQKEEREAQALTVMAGIAQPARPKPPAEAQPLPVGTVPVVEAQETETLVVPAPPYQETGPGEEAEKKKRHRNQTHGRKGGCRPEEEVNQTLG